MDLKVGDKIICKVDVLNGYRKILFTKGETYEIRIVFEKSDRYTDYVAVANNLTPQNPDKNFTQLSYPSFIEYFMSDQEIRKKKLKNINMFSISK